jgi:hypothetical protein
MMKTQYFYQLLLLVHGTIMMFIGLIIGVPLMVAIDLNWNAFEQHIWAVTHTSVTLTGVAFVAVSGTFDHLVHGKREAQILVGSLLLCAYTFTVGLITAGIFEVRGLAPTGPAANWVVFILFVIGAFSIIFGVAIMIIGAQRALRLTYRAETAKQSNPEK